MVKEHKGKHTRPKYKGMKEESSESDKELLDYIYGGYKQDVAEKEAEEVDTLRKQANRDLLKAYGFVRKKIAAFAAMVSRAFGFLTSKKRHFAYAGAAIVLVFAGFLGYDNFIAGDDPSDTLGVQAETPDFATLQPDGNSEGQFDAPTGRYSYQEEVAGRRVTVSQQQLPEDLDDQNTSVQQLALSLADKTSINRYETDKGQIYIVTLIGDFQRVLFSHQGLLVFMEANGIIDDAVWVDYVNSLE